MHNFSSNFHFLQGSSIEADILKAEKYAYLEPRYSAVLMRFVLETTLRNAYDYLPTLSLRGLGYNNKLADLIFNSEFKFALEGKAYLIDKIDEVRKIGNAAAHGKKFSANVIEGLKNLHSYLKWYAFEVLEEDADVDFDPNLIPKQYASDEDPKQLKEAIESLEVKAAEKEQWFETEIQKLKEKEDAKIKELEERIEAGQNPFNFQEVALTELMNKIWGRTYLNFEFLDEPYFAIKYFSYEGKAVEKIRLMKGQYEDSEFFKMYEEALDGLSVKSVLKGKFNHINMVGDFPKDIYGTPSNLLNKLIEETKEILQSGVKSVDDRKSITSQDQLDLAFEFKASFYKDNQHTYRNALSISLKDVQSEEINALVVMLNPGSSEPLEGIKNAYSNEPSTNQLKPCVPDDTQYQVARLMEKLNYKNALVINLMDVCTAESADAIELYLEAAEDELIPPFSIFHPSRKEELEHWLSKLKKDAPIILAWGMNPKLFPLKEKVNLELLKPTDRKIIGWGREERPHQYYHPWPRGMFENIRIAWPRVVAEQLP